MYNKSLKEIAESLEDQLKGHRNRNEILDANRYMSYVFSTTKNREFYYKISASFFNYLLFHVKTNKSGIAGIVYPSANTDRAGINVVIRKELIDLRILRCTSAAVYCFRRKSSNTFQAFPCSDITYPDKDGNLNFRINEAKRDSFD